MNERDKYRRDANIALGIIEPLLCARHHDNSCLIYYSVLFNPQNIVVSCVLPLPYFIDEET